MKSAVDLRWKLLVWAAFSSLFIIVAWRCFWISDDAMITFRSVLNLLDGHGARFNLAERVQAYTHPAWAALLALLGYVGMSIAGASLVLSLLFGLGVVALLTFAPPGGVRAWQAAALLALLFCSRTFIDYSSSGLENPLSVFLVLAAASCIKRSFVAFSAFCGLALLTRLDLLFALAIPFAFAAHGGMRRLDGRLRLDRQVFSGIALLLVPSLLAATASLFYYGNPFPNTALAKLTMSISLGERIEYGLAYWIDSFRYYDPLPLALLVLSITGALLSRSLTAAAWAAGGVTHFLYVVWTGGDFMAGRFTETALICGLISLAFTMAAFNRSRSLYSARWRPPRLLAAAGIAIGAFGATAAVPSVTAGAALRAPGLFGTGELADERGYWQHNHWTEALPVLVVMEKSNWGSAPQRAAAPVLVCGDLGLNGMLLGPGVSVLDLCGLADAFIARLPPARSKQWRAGHGMRNLPDGYYESLVFGRNLLVDGQLRALFDKVGAAVRADLFAPGRARAVWGLLTWKPEMPNQPLEDPPRVFRAQSQGELGRGTARMQLAVRLAFPDPDRAVGPSLLKGGRRLLH